MSGHTDREMLELAAKAAGIAGQIKPTADGAMWLFRDDNSPPWNPLTDDGDALRLAVKLNMLVDVAGEQAHTHAFGGSVSHYGEAIETHDGAYGPLEATRRAIVRAAAAIGESMP